MRLLNQADHFKEANPLVAAWLCMAPEISESPFA
jgi:hypothetical protein